MSEGFEASPSSLGDGAEAERSPQKKGRREDSGIQLEERDGRGICRLPWAVFGAVLLAQAQGGPAFAGSVLALSLHLVVRARVGALERSLRRPLGAQTTRAQTLALRRLVLKGVAKSLGRIGIPALALVWLLGAPDLVRLGVFLATGFLALRWSDQLEVEERVLGQIQEGRAPLRLGAKTESLFTDFGGYDPDEYEEALWQELGKSLPTSS